MATGLPKTVRSLEHQTLESFFGGRGACLPVASSTLGFILALTYATQHSKEEAGTPCYAVMPAFASPAAAHAAVWCGLTPLFCDIDPQTWLPSRKSILRILETHGPEVAAFIPSTFGKQLDLSWFETLQHETTIPVVIDGTGALGVTDAKGEQFGAGSRSLAVYSLGNLGLIYSADTQAISVLRRMNGSGLNDEGQIAFPAIGAPSDAPMLLHEQPYFLERSKTPYPIPNTQKVVSRMKPEDVLGISERRLLSV